MLNTLYKYLEKSWAERFCTRGDPTKLKIPGTSALQMAVGSAGWVGRGSGWRGGGKKETSDLMTVLNMLSGIDLSRESKKGNDN